MKKFLETDSGGGGKTDNVKKMCGVVVEEIEKVVEVGVVHVVFMWYRVQSTEFFAFIFL